MQRSDVDAVTEVKCKLSDDVIIKHRRYNSKRSVDRCLLKSYPFNKMIESEADVSQNGRHITVS